jgi:hypothetical protein
MVAFNKFNAFVENVAEGVHDLGADTLHVALAAAANTPAAANSVLADITQISGSNGYTTNGASTAQVSSAQSGGTYTLTLTDIQWTASGGDLGGASTSVQHAILFNNTPTSPLDPLIGYWTRASGVVVADGETLDWDTDISSAGTLTLA